MIEPHRWFELEYGLGDTRMPIRFAIDVHGFVAVEVGSEEVQGVYDTLCDVEQLEELHAVLSMVLKAAKEMRDE